MLKEENYAPWYTVARRFIPFIIIMILLHTCWFLVFVGYGKKVAKEFKDTAIGG